MEQLKAIIRNIMPLIESRKRLEDGPKNARRGAAADAPHPESVV
jgi:hypothetical protein